MKKITSCRARRDSLRRRIHVVVLPQHPAVTLVDANRARQRLRLALIVCKRGVEERGVLGRVGVRFDRAGQPADVVFADVERRAPAPVAIGVAVRDDHFRERGPIQDRPDALAVLIADGVEDEAFARVQRVAETPFLPAHFLAVDREAGSARLRDREPFRGGAHAGGLFVELLARRRHRHDAGIDHFDDLAGVHVHERDHAFDRPAVEIGLAANEIASPRASGAPAWCAAATWPTAQPSTCTVAMSVMPRLRIAACHSGLALTIVPVRRTRR